MVGCRDGTREREKRLLYLNSHIGVRSEHVYGGGRRREDLGRSRLHVFLTPGYRWEVLKVSFLSPVASFRMTGRPVTVTAVAVAIFSQTIERNNNCFQIKF